MSSTLLQVGLSSSALAVFTVLLCRMDAFGHCSPSIRRIAEDARLGKSTVEDAIRELESAGVIRVERAFKARSLYVLDAIINWNLSRNKEQISKKSVLKQGTEFCESVPNQGIKVTQNEFTAPLVVAVRWNDGKALEEDFWNWCASLTFLNRRLGNAALIPDDVRRSAKWLLNRAWNANAWFEAARKDITEWYSWPWTGKNEERRTSLRGLIKNWQEQADLAAYHIKKRKEFLAQAGEMP